MGTMAAYINNKFFLPLVLTEHSTRFLGHPDDTMTIVERLVAKYVLKNVDVLCPVSKNLEQAILNNFKVKRSVVVKNVVDSNVFTEQIKIPHATKTFLHISTLQNQQKNIDGLINAVAELSKLRSDFHLKIIGDGPSDELMSAIKKYQLSDTRFTFLGAQPITKVADEMKQADALVLFSNFENLPCVISEAHVSGIPVISTNVGGINEMIDASNGMLIDAKNIQQLLNALNDFLDGKHTFHSQEISNKAIENYSYEAVGTQFLNVYHSVLNK
jgi:glycosyltransferase involved in cell wall biosynthesis